LVLAGVSLVLTAMLIAGALVVVGWRRLSMRIVRTGVGRA
jgi:hypothetical protein